MPVTKSALSVYAKRRAKSSCRGRAIEACKTRSCKSTKATTKRKSYCRKSKNLRR